MEFDLELVKLLIDTRNIGDEILLKLAALELKQIQLISNNYTLELTDDNLFYLITDMIDYRINQDKKLENMSFNSISETYTKTGTGYPEHITKRIALFNQIGF